MSELVHLHLEDAVAVITLDSEHNRNALSRQLVTELGAHLDTAAADPDARVVLIRSAGRVFCSGADFSEAVADGMERGAAAVIDLQRRIAASPLPVVVEIAGPVRAGGLGIVGAADLVVAAQTVTFALTEVRLALAPAVISVSLLPRFTDRAAADLFLTGRTFDATEARAAGLVTRVVADEALADEVAAVLADLIEGHPQGLRETKRLLNRELLARIDSLGADLARQSAELFGSDEAREAMMAFLAKRSGG